MSKLINFKGSSKRKIYKRTHPYTVLSSLYHFAFLLIIPVIQSILFNPTNIIATITSLGFNILFIILIVFFSFVNYERTLYNLSSKKLHIKKGFFVKKVSAIPYKNITSIFIQKNVLPAMFNCAKIYIDTAGFVKQKSDFYILLSFKQTKVFVKSIFNTPKIYDFQYKSSIFKILILALTWSNSITGLLLFAPFVKNSGVILGQEYSQRLYDGVNIAVYIASIGLPPTTAYLAGILVFGYIVALVVQIFRYGRFSFEMYDKILCIRRGLIGRAVFITNIEHINSISIKQSLIMLVFRLKSVYINTIGIGKIKGDKSLLISVEKDEKLQQILSRVIDTNCYVEKEIKPEPKRIISYLMLPLFSLIFILPFYYILIRVGINIDIMNLSLTLALILDIVWFIFRLVAYKKSSLIKNNKGYIATTFVRMNIIENRIKAEKLQQIEICQSVIQKITKSCNIVLYVYGEKKTKYVIRHLEYRKAVDFLY